MVDVVTNQAAEQRHAETVNAEDNAAAEEMAQAAQEAAVQDEPAEVEESSSEQKQWDDILDEVDEDMPADATPGLEDPEPVVEEAEEVQEQETPEEPTPAEEIPQVEEQAEEVIVPPVEEPQDTRTQEEIQSEITKARETAREKLVESFKLTDEQVEQFEEDPAQVLSNMAADLYLDIYDSISQGIRTQMPTMVNGILQQQRAVQAAEQQFYGKWPQLAKAEYRDTVQRISTAYHSQNPNTDSETAVKEIGAQAWVALRLPLDELMAHTQDAPVNHMPTHVAPPPSHTPASAGNAPQSARAPQAAPMNEFEQLASELLIDDE